MKAGPRQGTNESNSVASVNFHTKQDSTYRHLILSHELASDNDSINRFVCTLHKETVFLEELIITQNIALFI